MNYKIKKAFANYKVGDDYKINPEIDLGKYVLSLLEHCGFIEPITEWSADKLKDGDTYYYVFSLGVDEGYWDGGKPDLFRLKSKNIYRTEEEAEEAYKRIMNS